MTELFMKIVNMSITASVLVLLVLVLRLILKKAPKWGNVLLWGLVAVRLVCPFGVESQFSLMPKTEWISEESVLTENETDWSSMPYEVLEPSIELALHPGKAPKLPTDPEIVVHTGVRMPFMFSCIWSCGTGAMLIYLAVSCLRIYRRIRTAKRFRDNIYTSEAVSSPFVFGVIKPRIYLLENMDAVSMNYVISHEEAHIRRRDHWWKPLGFLLLTVHWFNFVLS